MKRRTLAFGLVVAVAALPAWAAETAAERGRRALLEKSYNPAVWTRQAYDDVWKRWPGVTEKPADYDRAVRDYYGLHPAPYPNAGLPMGLREGWRLVTKGVSADCMICHGGSILGQSIVGLGNTALDIDALFKDLNAAAGMPPRLPFTFTNVRGTSEAGAMAVYLLGLRNPDLTFRTERLNLGLRDDMCEDAPPWWHLKKKKTMYHTGGADARSVRSIMQFMMGSLNGPDAFAKAEADFADILQYFLILEPPKYPFPVDAGLASTGRQLFSQHCARCHGTYGPGGAYPNKVIPLDEIGTDRRRFDGISETFARHYDESWFAQPELGGRGPAYRSRPTAGYQAPPLDGVWATAPYFHNGSAPTVYHVLNSKARPAVFTRSYHTGAEDYDPVKLGWKYREVPRPDAALPAVERRRVYDTTQPGRGNGGHTFGDALTEDERRAVIEYLKTL
jgi:mono/diheme cytochrome c family protein